MSARLLGGFLTHCCVEPTMRAAYEHGFEVITLTDRVAATSQDEHKNALKDDDPMFSKPAPSSELLGQLASRLPRCGARAFDRQCAG